MKTTTVETLLPPGLCVYRSAVTAPFRHPDVPAIFLDALSVRIPVFVDEQHCSAENEIDEDDSRSWHWVAYVSKTERPLDGKVAAGTIRLVPVAPLAGHTSAERIESDKSGEQALGPKHRKTEMWDGLEPFAKLGRMATLKEYRKLGLGRLLVDTALRWLEKNAGKMTQKIQTVAEDTVESGKATGEWKGLVLVHAQKEIERFWASVGFVRDDGMGTWWEEGIEHIAMWKRVTIVPRDEIGGLVREYS